MLTVSPNVSLPILLIQIEQDPRLGWEYAELLRHLMQNKPTAQIVAETGRPLRSTVRMITNLRQAGIIAGQRRNLTIQCHPDPIPHCTDIHYCQDWLDRVMQKMTKHAKRAKMLTETRQVVDKLTWLPCTDFKKALMEVALMFEDDPSHTGASARKPSSNKGRNKKQQQAADAAALRERIENEGFFVGELDGEELYVSPSNIPVVLSKKAEVHRHGKPNRMPNDMFDACLSAVDSFEPSLCSGTVRKIYDSMIAKDYDPRLAVVALLAYSPFYLRNNLLDYVSDNYRKNEAGLLAHKIRFETPSIGAYTLVHAVPVGLPWGVVNDRIVVDGLIPKQTNANDL